VPIPDSDEQFERYLQEFRPLAAPEELQIEKRPNSVRRRPLVWTACAVACAASVALAFFLWSHRPKQTQLPDGGVGPVVAPELANSQTLTIRRANALLTRATSLKEAADELFCQPQPTPQPQGKQSALAALSKENVRL
jgi:hypothetical protein